MIKIFFTLSIFYQNFNMLIKYNYNFLLNKRIYKNIYCSDSFISLLLHNVIYYCYIFSIYEIERQIFNNNNLYIIAISNY